MESFLKQKLQKDFIDCVNVDKAIVVGSIQKAEGTLILFDLLDYIGSDIASLDQEAWTVLKKAEKKIFEENEKRKDSLFMNKKPKDSSERREVQLDMLREDYRACKEVLFFIQNLCYEKGWFR